MLSSNLFDLEDAWGDVCHTWFNGRAVELKDWDTTGSFDAIIRTGLAM